MKLFVPFALTIILLQTADRSYADKRKLTCCTVIHAPVTETEGNDELAGLSRDYLSQLERDENLNIECFTTKVINYSDGTPGTGHTKFIQDMEACSTGNRPSNKSNFNICNCDMGAGGWLINEERYGKVDYLPPFVYSGFRVVIRKDSTFHGNEGLYFISTFSPSVWILIFGLITFFTLIKFIDIRFQPETLDKPYRPSLNKSDCIRGILNYLSKGTQPRKLRKAIMNTLKTIIGQEPSIREGYSPSTRHWLLDYVILLCGLFLVLSYEAAMTANLVQENIKSDYNTISDFKYCRINASSVCLAKGGAVEAFWKSAIRDACKRNCDSDCEPMLLSSYQNATDALVRGDCNYMLSEEMTAKHVARRRHCNKLLITGETAVLNGMSFILPKNSNLTHNLSLATLKLRDKEKLLSVDDYLSRNGGECHVDQISSTITLSKMKSFFILAYLASFVLLILMIFDPYRWKNNHDEQDTSGDDNNRDEIFGK